MRTPNYRQQKKAREDARKVRQAQKNERRQVPAQEGEPGVSGHDPENESPGSMPSPADPS